MLAATAVLHVVVVVISGSVALLADTIHNAGDALTAIPLAAAFILGRRPATSRLTYGYGRAEDLAGLTVLAIILFSAVFAGYEAIRRMIDPTDPGYLVAVALAGLIGFVGNEWVAVYRIRSGRRIGSAALVAEGHAVAVAVRGRLIERVEHLGEAIVHVDPPSAPGEAHHEPHRHNAQTQPLTAG